MFVYLIGIVCMYVKCMFIGNSLTINAFCVQNRLAINNLARKNNNSAYSRNKKVCLHGLYLLLGKWNFEISRINATDLLVLAETIFLYDCI